MLGFIIVVKLFVNVFVGFGSKSSYCMNVSKKKLRGDCMMCCNKFILEIYKNL